jgi:hypothetical protein
MFGNIEKKKENIEKTKNKTGCTDLCEMVFEPFTSTLWYPFLPHIK